MKVDEFRKLALSLPDAVESAHMKHPDFRVAGKIFATLGAPDDDWGMVKLTPQQQQSLVAADPKSFQPSSGAWGKRGCTNIRLPAAKKSIVRAAIEMAFENVSSAPPKKRKTTRSSAGQSKPSGIQRPSKSVLAQFRKRIVRLVEPLPEATVTDTDEGHLSLEVRGKRFGWFLADHHGDGRVALNLKAARGDNKTLAQKHPDRFHIPKYLGHHGWVGLWLDVPNVDWDEVGSVLEAAYRLTAPKTLLTQL